MIFAKKILSIFANFLQIGYFFAFSFYPFWVCFVCRVYLSAVIGCFWLSVSPVDCRLLLLLVVVGSRLSGVGC